MRVSANQFKAAVGVVALAGIALSTPALAAPVYCSENTANNHMIIDSSVVSGCLGAGVGNITGETSNDIFINGATGDGYESAGKSDEANPFNITFTQVQPNGSTTGTFSFDASFWDNAISGAIGFQFGTGNRADEWFVFELQRGQTSGVFEFVNVFGRGGGLSHVNLYRVPEPSGLVMLGLGVFGASLARRRTKVA
jgi:hypothetical protein